MVRKLARRITEPARREGSVPKKPKSKKKSGRSMKKRPRDCSSTPGSESLAKQVADLTATVEVLRQENTKLVAEAQAASNKRQRVAGTSGALHLSTPPPVQRTQSSPHARAQLKVVEAAIKAVDAGQTTTTIDDAPAPATSTAPSDAADPAAPSDAADPRAALPVAIKTPREGFHSLVRACAREGGHTIEKVLFWSSWSLIVISQTMW
jgi:hypothetical protein